MKSITRQTIINWVFSISIIVNIIQYFKKPKTIIIEKLSDFSKQNFEKEVIKEVKIEEDLFDNNLNINNENIQLKSIDEVNERIEFFKKESLKKKKSSEENN